MSTMRLVAFHPHVRLELLSFKLCPIVALIPVPIEANFSRTELDRNTLASRRGDGFPALRIIRRTPAATDAIVIVDSFTKLQVRLCNLFLLNF